MLQHVFDTGLDECWRLVSLVRHASRGRTDRLVKSSPANQRIPLVHQPEGKLVAQVQCQPDQTHVGGDAQSCESDDRVSTSAELVSMNTILS